MLDGKVSGDCMPRQRQQECSWCLWKSDGETAPELDLRVSVDNYATHKHCGVKSWLYRHLRFYLHFISTSSLVELGGEVVWTSDKWIGEFGEWE